MFRFNAQLVTVQNLELYLCTFAELKANGSLCYNRVDTLKNVSLTKPHIMKNFELWANTIIFYFDDFYKTNQPNVFQRHKLQLITSLFGSNRQTRLLVNSFI